MSRAGFALYMVGLACALLFAIWSILRSDDCRRAREEREDLQACSDLLHAAGVERPRYPELNRVCGALIERQVLAGRGGQAVAWDCTNFGRYYLGLDEITPTANAWREACLTVFPLDYWLEP